MNLECFQPTNVMFHFCQHFKQVRKLVKKSCFQQLVTRWHGHLWSAQGLQKDWFPQWRQQPFCSSPVGIELVGAIKHFKWGKKIPRGFLQSFLKVKWEKKSFSFYYAIKNNQLWCSIRDIPIGFTAHSSHLLWKQRTVFQWCMLL